MNSFWSELKTPFTVLAPMEGVTDSVFRQIIIQVGKPDVLFTEFTNCDGLMSTGREKVAESLKFSKKEDPIVAQIWGINPKTFYESAKYCKELGFSGIDINMGCPVRTVISEGACSALIKNHQLTKEIILATKEGAGGLPVSVKTRLGFSKIEIEEWIGFLLEQDLAALIIHLRTVSELSKVDAHWDLMPEIIKLRDKISPKTKIIGNGDIMNLSHVQNLYKKYKCDGFMIGRGVFANPWIFNSKVQLETITVQNRLDLFIKHIQLFDKTWRGKKNPANLKKFCKTYIQNFPEAAHLREKIMESKSTSEMLAILSNYKV